MNQGVWFRFICIELLLSATRRRRRISSSKLLLSFVVCDAVLYFFLCVFRSLNFMYLRINCNAGIADYILSFCFFFVINSRSHLTRNDDLWIFFWFFTKLYFHFLSTIHFYSVVLFSVEGLVGSVGKIQEPHTKKRNHLLRCFQKSIRITFNCYPHKKVKTKRKIPKDGDCNLFSFVCRERKCK